MRLISICSIALLFVACGGDKDDAADGNTGDTGGGTTGGDDDDDDDDTVTAGYNVEGMAIDVATQGPAAAGLCVELLDPTPALSGQEPTVLASGTLDAAGAYAFTGITAKPALGLLVEVADCGTPNTTVYTSATGISPDDYLDLAEGATLSGVQSFSIDMVLLAGMDASAEPLGYTGDLATDGMMFGFVLDSGGTPLEGITVTCGTCSFTFYMDGDSGDGLFTTGLAPNAGTVATAGASFMIPAAPIGSYVATDPSGTYTFGDLVAGSNPGAATIVALFAD